MTDLLNDADIDFDHAVSAFPDISLDGEGEFPTFSSPPPAVRHSTAGPFDLDAFGSPAPSSREVKVVKVTGHQDEEIQKFENEFPELDVPQVRCAGVLLARLQRASGLDADDDTTGGQPPRHTTHLRRCAAFCAASAALGALCNSHPDPTDRRRGTRSYQVPLLLLPTPAYAYVFDRQWRERQADEIKARDERSKARRQETISKAERSIDQFYEEYTGKRERQIRENKCVLFLPLRKPVLLITFKSEIRRLSMLRPRLMHCHTGRHGIVFATLSNSKIRKARHSRALDLERQNSLDIVRCFCACGAKAQAHQARRDTEPRELLHFSLEP